MTISVQWRQNSYIRTQIPVLSLNRFWRAWRQLIKNVRFSTLLKYSLLQLVIKAKTDQKPFALSEIGFFAMFKSRLILCQSTRSVENVKKWTKWSNFTPSHDIISKTTSAYEWYTAKLKDREVRRRCILSSRSLLMRLQIEHEALLYRFDKRWVTTNLWILASLVVKSSPTVLKVFFTELNISGGTSSCTGSCSPRGGHQKSIWIVCYKRGEPICYHWTQNTLVLSA